ncbi:tryptophan-rich sensory protein [Flavobacteriaceae bacterium]|jgi:translocator protein|nr:tryptophan-rich sensory protein [Flavobacteriaceae bacterium]MDB4404553.1 tryptophan-rich sensory protein [bacterium]
MKHFGYTALFLFVNFLGLYVGSLLMDQGPSSFWYLGLNQAPWTPPGWVFGIAWSSIMICFSIYLTYLLQDFNSIIFWIIYIIQCILNISWNYVFFNLHSTVYGLIIIVLLTIVIVFYFFNFKSPQLMFKKYLLFPYILWLFIASSLNLYIVIYN